VEGAGVGESGYVEAHVKRESVSYIDDHNALVALDASQKNFSPFQLWPIACCH
jgi:hypothetical protein